ncbi:MAG: hypothetical protein ACRD36_06130, partial [Candidatus Acidiferrum sp.]
NQASVVLEIMRHRRVLLERAQLLRGLRKSDLLTNPRISPLIEEQILWTLAPRGSLTLPIGGPLLTEASWWSLAAALGELQQQELVGRPFNPADLTAAADPPQSSKNAGNSGDSSAAAATQSPLPDSRPLAVGFLAGVVVGILALMQWNEWMRRRRTAAPQRQRTAR